MSDLRLALQEAGLLAMVEAKAHSLGTTIEGAIRAVCSLETQPATKPVTGTAAFDDAVCAELNKSGIKPYAVWREAAEREAGCQLDHMGVYLYALCGKVSTSLVSSEELDIIEEVIDRVSGQ